MFAFRVREIMRSALFSFSQVELNNADLDIADQNGEVRWVRGVRRVHVIHLALPTSLAQLSFELTFCKGLLSGWVLAVLNFEIPMNILLTVCS